MILEVLQSAFSVCQVEDVQSVDSGQELYFVGKTDEEISVVCETDRVPANVLKREDGWRAVRVQGVLDFSLIGILARILKVLAEAEVGVFVISTYRTDYILMKEEQMEAGLGALQSAGYELQNIGLSR